MLQLPTGQPTVGGLRAFFMTILKRILDLFSIRHSNPNLFFKTAIKDSISDWEKDSTQRVTVPFILLKVPSSWIQKASPTGVKSSPMLIGTSFLPSK